MSTHMSGFSGFLHYFVMIKLASSSIRVNHSNAEATFENHLTILAKNLTSKSIAGI